MLTKLSKNSCLSSAECFGLVLLLMAVLSSVCFGSEGGGDSRSDVGTVWIEEAARDLEIMEGTRGELVFRLSRSPHVSSSPGPLVPGDVPPEKTARTQSLSPLDAYRALLMSIQRRPEDQQYDLDNDQRVTSRDAALILRQSQPVIE